MKRLFFLCLVVAVASVSADSVETTAEFALDNAFANMAIRSGETIPVVRDAAWAEGGVVFTMTGAAPEVLTEGARTTLTVPTVSHCKVLRLVLEMAGASYERIFLVCDGDPNVEAVAMGEFALDSRTGEVRKAREVEPLRYSSFWSKGATRPEITINGGPVTMPDAAEGDYAWGVRRPHVAADLPGGIYALEHFDGVERLTATFRVPRQSLILLMR